MRSTDTRSVGAFSALFRPGSAESSAPPTQGRRGRFSRAAAFGSAESCAPPTQGRRGRLSLPKSDDLIIARVLLMVGRRRGCYRNEFCSSMLEERTHVPIPLAFRHRSQLARPSAIPKHFGGWVMAPRREALCVVGFCRSRGTTSIAGTTTYGMVMGILGGPGEMALDGLRCTAAAGIGWCLPLPALYILNSLSGSRLRPSTTFLAALVTTSWGGLAMIAAIPIAWFFRGGCRTRPCCW